MNEILLAIIINGDGCLGKRGEGEHLVEDWGRRSRTSTRTCALKAKGIRRFHQSRWKSVRKLGQVSLSCNQHRVERCTRAAYGIVERRNRGGEGRMVLFQWF